MSRFIQGNCVHIMSGFPDNAVDFILTDPPYLVGFRDRQGRTIAGDKTDEWLQPACHEMYRVLKKDALMVSFYGWNRVDRFMAGPLGKRKLSYVKRFKLTGDFVPLSANP